MQYFYIVVYTIVGDDMTMCKIGLNPHKLIEWGRREATKYPERTYKLFRQSITRTGTITFYKSLTPFKSKTHKVAPVIPFYWNEFDDNKGFDFETD